MEKPRPIHRKPVRTAPGLTEQQFDKSSVATWWEKVRNHPNWFHIQDAIKRRSRYQRGIKESEHAQIKVDSYFEGMEHTLDLLTGLRAADQGESSQDGIIIIDEPDFVQKP